MSELPELLQNVFTPECEDDTDGVMPLGRTSILGRSLTPEETEQFALKMLEHARTARIAAGLPISVPHRPSYPPSAADLD